MLQSLVRSARIAWFMAVVAGSAVPLARADIITMDDGRKFEGEIVSQDDAWVSIDTVIEGVRATIGLNQSAVKDIEKKPLPPKFFDPPPVEARISDPKKFKPGQTLYLEVPIIGAVGKDVFADAFAAILSYANRNRIGHIVFTIDCAGRDFDEAMAIYEVLKAKKGDLKLHGIIRRCAGSALAVPLWCDTLRLLPGGVLGGTGEEGKAGDEIDSVLAAQIATKVVADTKRTGLAAEMCRAIFDPSVALVVWKDDEGAVQFDVEAPAGLPADRIILEAKEGQLLTITQKQTIALGMPPFKGGALELGAALKLPEWTAESDYGQKTMARIGAEKAKKAEKEETAKLAKVTKNVTRREETKKYVQHNIDQAKAWDPTKGEYNTIEHCWSGYGWGEGWNTQYLTKESKRKWKTRTDACMYYLKRTGEGLLALKRLDKEAVALGLEPTFKGDEIDNSLRDLEVWINALARHRNKEQK